MAKFEVNGGPMRNPRLDNVIITACRNSLIKKRSELLNRLHALNINFIQSDRESGGDEIDMTIRQLEEHEYVINQHRLRDQIYEIELALARIESGNFGMCEETSEPIEIERLLAIPWTRLSIEGAEMRESSSRRFAK